MHQVGQIQLTLMGERSEVLVMLEEVQQLGGVGHPEGESAGDGLLPLKGKNLDTEDGRCEFTVLYVHFFRCTVFGVS